MIQNDARLIRRFVEHWERQIPLYVEKHGHNMTARNILSPRGVGEDVAVDVVTKYEKTGEGASVTAKGAVPKLLDMEATPVYHTVWQIAAAIRLHQKDLKADPLSKSRLLDVALRDIHKMEDSITINGLEKLGITGIVGAARKNSNGKITTSKNHGAWSGEAGTDLYADINDGLALLGDDVDQNDMVLLGKKNDLLHLNDLDSERRPYYEKVSGLFNKKNPNDKSWIWISSQVPAGYVYLVPKDFTVAEFVVAENPHIISYDMQPGQNYYFEVVGWVTPEIHQNVGIVEIATG